METAGNRENDRECAAECFLVHIVDDDDRFRTSVLRLLRSKNIRAVGYSTVAEFERAEADDTPGCVLLDTCMPDGDGLAMFERVVGEESVLPVIFVSAHADIPTSVRVMKSGALDILVKPVRGEQLLGTIDHARKVALRRYAAHTEVRGLLERYRTLTDRERAVFAGIAEGKLNKQVAVEVGACERTIKSERAKMMKKLQLTRLVDVVRAAEMVGLKLSFDGPTAERQQ